MNRYNLDVELTADQDEAFWKVEEAKGAVVMARRIREYWSVFDRNLGDEYARQKIADTYGADKEDMFFIAEDEYTFVIEDTNLASELIRVLGLDFVHDFKTGLFLFDIWARHELIMGYLYETIEGSRYKYKGDTFRDRAELYVQKGYGCYKSTQSKRIWFGEDVAIPKYFSQFKDRFGRL